MNIKRVLILAGLVAMAVTWFYSRGCDKRIDSSIGSTTLAPNVAEKLIVNPANHTLVMVTSSGHTQTVFLPDRPSSIEVGKDGKVKVSVRAFGTEVVPFIGFAYSDQARLALGVSGLYYKRFDLGAALFPTVSGKFTIRAGVVVSYNVASNTSLFLGVVNTGSPIGGISLKF
jgi:hypothetical protein